MEVKAAFYIAAFIVININYFKYLNIQKICICHKLSVNAVNEL